MANETEGVAAKLVGDASRRYFDTIGTPGNRGSRSRSHDSGLRRSTGVICQRIVVHGIVLPVSASNTLR